MKNFYNSPTAELLVFVKEDILFLSNEDENDNIVEDDFKPAAGL